MRKIAHVRELEFITDLPAKVLKVIEEAVTILDTEYGEDRDATADTAAMSLSLSQKATCSS